MDNNQYPNQDPNQQPQQPQYQAPQDPNQQPQYQAPVQPQYQPYQPAPVGYSQPKNQNALWGMILGIASIVLCWAYIGLPAGIVGLILSLKARKETTPETGRGMATAGLICSIVGIVAGAIIYVSCILVYCAAMSYSYYY